MIYQRDQSLPNHIKSTLPRNSWKRQVAMWSWKPGKFCLVNDTYGHTRGDEVLVSFVEGVKANLRTTDQRTYHAKQAGRGRVTGKLGE